MIKQCPWTSIGSVIVNWITGKKKLIVTTACSQMLKFATTNKKILPVSIS